jgi:hypothetical protein|eukprot:COSAG01_NODE_1828_length_9126_cov_53.025479_11_plen_127_part_00
MLLGSGCSVCAALIRWTYPSGAVDQWYTEEMYRTHELLRQRRQKWVISDEEPVYNDSEQLKQAICDCELEEEIHRDVSRTVRRQRLLPVVQPQPDRSNVVDFAALRYAFFSNVSAGRRKQLWHPGT